MQTCSDDFSVRWPSGSPWESLKQKLEHQPRLGAKVMSILKLPKVLLQVLRGNPNVSPVDAALQRTPEAFDGVHVYVAANVLFLRVVNPFVLEAMLPQITIGLPFVGMDAGTLGNPFHDGRNHVLNAATSDLPGQNLTPALDHAKDMKALSTSTTRLPLSGPPKMRSPSTQPMYLRIS